MFRIAGLGRRVAGAVSTGSRVRGVRKQALSCARLLETAGLSGSKGLGGILGAASLAFFGWQPLGVW